MGLRGIEPTRCRFRSPEGAAQPLKERGDSSFDLRGEPGRVPSHRADYLPAPVQVSAHPLRVRLRGQINGRSGAVSTGRELRWGSADSVRIAIALVLSPPFGGRVVQRAGPFTVTPPPPTIMDPGSGSGLAVLPRPSLGTFALAAVVACSVVLGWSPPSPLGTHLPRDRPGPVRSRVP